MRIRFATRHYARYEKGYSSPANGSEERFTLHQRGLEAEL